MLYFLSATGAGGTLARRAGRDLTDEAPAAPRVGLGESVCRVRSTVNSARLLLRALLQALDAGRDEGRLIEMLGRMLFGWAD